MFKRDLEKAEEPEIKLPIIEKARKLQKNICFIDYAKVFEFVGHNKLWKILKEMGIPHHNRLVPYRERGKSRLYIVTLLI